MKQRIRLTESQLKNIISRSINKVINEDLDVDNDDVWRNADLDSEKEWLDSFGKMPEGYDDDITDDDTIDRIIAMNDGNYFNKSNSAKRAEKLASWEAFDKDRDENNRWITRDEDEADGMLDMLNNNIKEQAIKRIVRESVNRVLNETDAFKQVDNLNDYVASNGLKMKPASKFQRVNAQSGKSYINQYGKQHGMDKRQIGRMVRRGGAPLSTIASDGTQETNNIVTKNHTVLNNVGNTANRWAPETSTFKRKYEQDPSANGVYKQKGGPMNAAQINEPISFTAPWGQKMNIDNGGYILQDPNNPNDIYGISGEDFKKTYRFDENRILRNYI